MDWESISRKFTRAGQNVESKMKETANLLTLQQKQAAVKNKLDDIYAEIGRQYFASCTEDPAGYEEAFAQIRQLQAEIEENQSKINEIKGGRTCPYCGARNSADARFCGKCGAKLPEPSPAQSAPQNEAGQQAEETNTPQAESQNEAGQQPEGTDPAQEAEAQPGTERTEYTAGTVSDTQTDHQQ